MFPEATRHTLIRSLSAYAVVDHSLSRVPSVFIVLAVSLLLWRIWTFTIAPALRPREPKILPYWIPVLGHVVPFFKNSDAVFTFGREYFGNTREPYTISVVGENIYVLTSPQDVAAVYKSKSLSFDPVMRDVVATFGATPSSAEKMWQSPADQGSANPRKSFMELSHENYKAQLHPGAKLDTLQDRFLGSIDESLRWQNISHNVVRSSSQETKIVSLLGWCSEVLIDSATRAFFGPRLLQIEPNLLQSSIDFDDNSWKFNYQIPRFLAKETYTAKDRITVALEKYFNLPEEEREESAWMIQALEMDMRKVGLDEQQLASMIMVLHWVINANAYKLCFWVLSYLLYDPALFKVIRDEVKPAFSEESTNLQYLLQSCPRLESVYNEVLRIANMPIGARGVLSDVEIGGKTLLAGRKVLMPYRQLHFDEDVFGSNVRHFDPDRFLNNKDLSRSPSYRPFGGASTLCPGRFLAKREVYMFVALVLHRFDISLATAEKDVSSVAGEKPSPPAFPRLDEAKPTGGMMGPIAGDDVYINVRTLA
ncbi:MAG: hypothetical protein M1837_005283 [Sclerophora amabilis]|nr:MAG: hypothetical protein M1837_005283 [Sclerophora amabilis]